MSINKKTMKLALEKDGNITSPSLHDVEVTSISMPSVKESKELVVGLISESGVKYEAVFAGCRSISFKGFYFQNVISQAFLQDAQWVLTKLDDYTNEFGVQSSYDKNALIEDIKKNRMVLVEFVPSVGCALLCLCEKFEILEIG